MTDNRTTERLMAMLEERGVKHELEHDLYVEWVDARGNEVTAFETSCKHRGDVLIVHVFLTPEQAIAATLGSVELDEDTDTDNESEYAITCNVIRDFCKDAIRSGRVPTDYEIDWLVGKYIVTAEQGIDTCEMVLMWSDYEDGECYKCSKCGDFAFTCGGEPRFCPECGAKVVGK